jgi:predicted N-acetyltransferase YhbS
VTAITCRTLRPGEVSRVDEIDRAEVIDHIYRLVDGQLVLEELHIDVEGWEPGALARHQRRIHACIDRGGAAWGAFNGDRLAGIAVLDGKRIGRARDTLDLYFLHVSNGLRDRGIGRALVDLVKARALELGARRLYVSASPSHHTVRFYLGAGFAVTTDVDPELFALEPEDIHMDMALVPAR